MRIIVMIITKINNMNANFKIKNFQIKIKNRSNKFLK